MIALCTSTDRFSFFACPESLSKIPHMLLHHAAHFFRLWITSVPGILWLVNSTDYSNDWESDGTGSRFKDGL